MTTRRRLLLFGLPAVTLAGLLAVWLLWLRQPSQPGITLANAAIEFGDWPAMYSRNSQKSVRVLLVGRGFLAEIFFMSVFRAG